MLTGVHMNRKQIDNLLAEIRATREEGLAALKDLDESEFSLSTASRPWRWDTLIRVLLQFGNHMREHAVQVEGTRAKIERLPTHPQRVHAQAEAAWGLLLASLVGLNDEDLDAKPPDGGWTIRQALEHIRKSERDYLDAILLARQNT
jgi:hypothetical protein